MGVDSGLPDFRGNEGFWNAYPPYRKFGLSFIDLAHPRWFHSQPRQAWGFYGHRLQLYRSTDPHPGFEILRRWTAAKNNNYFIYTSNVDGQFQKAGFSGQQVVECHGSIHHLQCHRPCDDAIWSASDYQPRIDDATMLADSSLPACPTCHGIARPNILMFGDSGWIHDRSSRQEGRYRQWRAGNEPGDVLLEFGAGTAVPTVRYEFAQLQGTLIRVNPRESQTRHGIAVACGALEFLQRVDDLLQTGR